MKRVTFHPEAEAEMRAAAEFYETRRRGLGVDFIGEVERATQALVAYSRIGHRFSRRLRRVLVQRFPYGLLYRVDREWIFGRCRTRAAATWVLAYSRTCLTRG